MLTIPIDIHTEDADGNCLTTLEDMTFEWGGKTFTVPAGFNSDGASVPRPFWAATTPPLDPRTIRAAIAHDYIYRTQPEGWTRKEADRMFYDFSREDGLRLIPAKRAYIGLRIFGGIAWEENRLKIEEAKK